jgi:hypothetical protein
MKTIPGLEASGIWSLSYPNGVFRLNVMQCLVYGEFTHATNKNLLWVEFGD